MKHKTATRLYIIDMTVINIRLYMSHLPVVISKAGTPAWFLEEAVQSSGKVHESVAQKKKPKTNNCKDIRILEVVRTSI